MHRLNDHGRCSRHLFINTPPFLVKGSLSSVVRNTVVRKAAEAGGPRHVLVLCGSPSRWAILANHLSSFIKYKWESPWVRTRPGAEAQPLVRHTTVERWNDYCVPIKDLSKWEWALHWAREPMVPWYQVKMGPGSGNFQVLSDKQLPTQPHTTSGLKNFCEV